MFTPPSGRNCPLPRNRGTTSRGRSSRSIFEWKKGLQRPAGRVNAPAVPGTIFCASLLLPLSRKSHRDSLSVSHLWGSVHFGGTLRVRPTPQR